MNLLKDIRLGLSPIDVLNKRESIMRKFSIIVRFTSIHLFLAMMAILDLALHHMDVKTVFLNGELNKKIYMEQSMSFIEMD